MTVASVQIEPWFGGTRITVHPVADTAKVTYSWSRRADATEDSEPTIHDLLIWHDCDQSLGKVDGYDRPGWTPWGAGLHTLVTVEPLHIEASVYYPECCGLHGWVRDGRWMSA